MVFLSAMFSGLTLGLLGLDKTGLEIVMGGELFRLLHGDGSTENLLSPSDTAFYAANVASVVANATRATAHGRVDRRRPMRDHRHRVARYVSRRASRDDRGS